MEIQNKLNIVQLIEKNPITRLTKSYQNKFIEKIRGNFTETQQQLYVSSFYLYLNHSKDDYIIDLDNIWKWLGFERKDFCKKLLKKHFSLDIDYKITVAKAASPAGEAGINTGGSGLNKETILLKINTFKKLCLKSNTKKADEIHDYFIKLEDTLTEVVNEESDELKLQLQIKDININKLTDNMVSEKHNLLLNRYAKSGSLVYIIKVKSYENGNFIIKIGQSIIGLEPRYNKHKVNYEESTILDCFKVDKSLEFESFIHNYMKSCIVIDLPNHINEKELFLVKTQEQYNKLISIIQDNSKRFNNTDYAQISDLQDELDKVNSSVTKQNINNFNQKSIDKIIENQSKILELITNLNERQIKIENIITTNLNINKKPEEKYNTIVKEERGPKVLQINPETLKINKVYDTIIELLNADTNTHINRNSLKRAVDKKSIYRNYRWMFIDRTQILDNLVIPQTNLNEEIKCVGFIAQLNENQTEIINVYYSMQEAIRLSRNGHISRNNKHYILYDTCEQQLIVNFERIHGKPLLYINGVGQFDDESNLINEFSSKQNCFRKSNISRSLLDKLIKTNTIHNGYTYKYIGKKSKLL